MTTEERALERYRYLMRMAPPSEIEAAHADAFGQLAPAERRAVLIAVRGEVQPQERAISTEPFELAHMATRAEVRHPGAVERALGTGGLLTAVVGGVLASAVLVPTEVIDVF